MDDLTSTGFMCPRDLAEAAARQLIDHRAKFTVDATGTGPHVWFTVYGEASFTVVTLTRPAQPSV